MATALELRQAAHLLDEQAGGLPALLDAVAAAGGPSVWRGPVADRFAAEVDDRRRRLSAVADELQGVARAMMVAAERLEADAVLPATPIVRFGRVI